MKAPAAEWWSAREYVKSGTALIGTASGSSSMKPARSAVGTTAYVSVKAAEPAARQSAFISSRSMRTSTSWKRLSPRLYR